MSHMLACVNAGKVSKTGFNRRGIAMHHVQACLSARNDQESSFHYCGNTVDLVQTCVCAGRSDKAVLPAVEVLGSTCRAV